MKKQSFIKGTAILMAANAVSKILGAVFKIPLTYILNEEGMAIYSTAFCVYSTLLTLFISGFPFALSKAVAELGALGRSSDSERLVTLSAVLLGVLGAAASLFLFVFADFFAVAMKDEKAVFAIKAISPSVFFVAIGAVYKSYFQGCSHMTPTAISQVIEAFIKLAAGLLLALAASSAALEVTAAAAICGVTIGEIIATAILWLLYLPCRSGTQKSDSDSKSLLSPLLTIGMPMTLTASISSLLSLADVTVVRNSLWKIHFTPESAEAFLLKYSGSTSLFDNLPETLTLSPDGARWLYGAYSGYALTVFNLPLGIVGSIGVALLPIVAASVATSDKIKLSVAVKSASSLSMLIAVPSAAVLAVFPENVLDLLFGNSASEGLLLTLAPCILFLTVCQLCSSFLHAAGYIFEPFLASVAGVLIKITLSTILIRIPYINIMGAPIASDISCFIMMLMLLQQLKKHLHLVPFSVKVIIKPIISSVMMCVVMLLSTMPLSLMLKSDSLGFIGGGILGLCTYLLMLSLTDAVDIKALRTLKN